MIGLPSQLHSLLKDGSFLTCGGGSSEGLEVCRIGAFAALLVIGVGEIGRPNGKVDTVVVRLLSKFLGSDVELELAHFSDAQGCSLARGGVSGGNGVSI